MFEDQPKIENFICHSGGAEGSDTYWEVLGEPFGVKTLAYSYKTSIHKSKNKIEISEIDYQEGVSEINKANKILSRYGIHKYMNLLARNWTQVKYSKQVFAIGLIVDPGRRGSRGYYNKSNFQVAIHNLSFQILQYRSSRSLLPRQWQRPYRLTYPSIRYQ